MKQARHENGRWLLAWMAALVLVTSACQKTGPLQGVIQKPGDKKADAPSEPQDENNDEKVTPPSNIIGSYLVCQELEQLQNIQQNAQVGCGLYTGFNQSLVELGNFNQWQVASDYPMIARPLVPGSPNQIELVFQAPNDLGLKQAVRNTKLLLQDNAGIKYEGFLGDLLPANNRFATQNKDKIGQWLPYWNEGFESTAITEASWLFHDPKLFSSSVQFNWANPVSQTQACGTPVLEIFHDIGAAEGLQYMDSDSDCWPTNSAGPIFGPGNLAIAKELQLYTGRTYRLSFKVRQQVAPAGVVAGAQALQLRINQKVVLDLRSFSSTWQEISLDWIARGGSNTIEWVDMGSGTDTVGVHLDDLRVRLEEFP